MGGTFAVFTVFITSYIIHRLFTSGWGRSAGVPTRSKQRSSRRALKVSWDPLDNTLLRTRTSALRQRQPALPRSGGLTGFVHPSTLARMEWRFYGPDAVLIQFAQRVGDEAFERSRALVAELERHPPAGLIEFVPAFTTLLLEFDAAVATDLNATVSELVNRLTKVATQPLPQARLHEIPVVYDGADLERVAKAHQISPEEVCRLHREPVYKVYCLGFAPGFPYLGDLNPRLHTARLATPRTRIPAGAVAIGGEHTGIYPVASPGGWNIIGHTDVALFDPSRRDEQHDDAAAFLLRAGDRVKFVAATQPTS